MPVIGGPTPYHQKLLLPRPNDTVRQAVLELAHLLPKAYRFVTSVGFGLRKRRLGLELAEFDFLHRLRRGRPASLEQLCRVGDAIIKQRKRSFPAGAPRLDEPLFVNTASFDRLIAIAGGDQSNCNKGDPL